MPTIFPIPAILWARPEWTSHRYYRYVNFSNTLDWGPNLDKDYDILEVAHVN